MSPAIGNARSETLLANILHEVQMLRSTVGEMQAQIEVLVEREVVTGLVVGLAPRPEVYRDGDQWCALHGDDITEGICGFGDTPALALAAYYTSFKTSDAQVTAALEREAPRP